MRTLIKYYFLIFLIPLATLETFAQNAYYFKKWKSKQIFAEKTIIFQIDTSGTEEEARPYLLAIDRTLKRLDSLDFSYKIIPYPSDTIISEEFLLLRFEKLPSAYVKLSGSKDMPACYRMKVFQSNSNAKKRIETTASISIPQFGIGIDQFGKAFALKLNDHFIMEKKETDTDIE